MTVMTADEIVALLDQRIRWHERRLKLAADRFRRTEAAGLDASEERGAIDSLAYVRRIIVGVCPRCSQPTVVTTGEQTCQTIPPS